MIEKLQIQNFQRHDKLRVLFDEKITTIVGPSDTGKSSTLRAIRWLVFNRPSGTGFIRHGETTCSVKLWANGHKIERKKSKGKNVYLVDDKQLSAVGTDVPESVKSILNMSLENFQGQHDAPFWFSLTPGEVGKRLNSIVDLEVIDKSTAWLASMLRKIKVELEVAEKRLKDEVEEQEKLSFVKDIAADFGVLRGQYQAVKTSKVSRNGLRDCLERMVETEQRARTLRTAAEQGFGVISVAYEFEVAYERFSGLFADVKRLETIEAKMERLRQNVNTAEKQLKTKTGGICPLCGGVMK